MAQKKVEEILKKIAAKYELNWHVVEEVYNSQFKKVKLEVSSLEFPVIKLPNWGKFIPSKAKLEKTDYTERRLKKQAKLNGDNSNKDTTLDGV